MSQISINDKIEETERLKEFIIMEEEKLEEAKRTFEEDVEKFNRYIEELENRANEAMEAAKKTTKIKNEKSDQIATITSRIQEKESESKKIEEILDEFSGYKEFLDDLSCYAGKKKNLNSDSNGDLEEFSKFGKNFEEPMNSGPNPKNTSKKVAPPQQNQGAFGNFFVTQ